MSTRTQFPATQKTARPMRTPRFSIVHIALGALLTLALTLANFAFAQEPHDESGDEIMKREMYFHERRAGGPDKILPPGAYDAAVHEASRMKKDRDEFKSPTALTSWVNVNPNGMVYAMTGNNYISGRTNCIAFDPISPTVFYIAAAGGGVWKTTDSGATFTILTDNLSALTAGAVAVDPNNRNVVYVGTGELNYSSDSYYGNGIFKSTDGGTTWTQAGAAAVVGYRFSALIVDPTNSNVLYAAGSGGVLKSTDAGVSWNTIDPVGNTNSMVMDPSNTQVLYVSYGNGSSAPNVVIKTTDGGSSWTSLTNGLPSSNTARITLAISQSNPAILYASVARADNWELLGLYRSSNSGGSWTLQNASTNYLGTQGWYDNTITVNPLNPDFIAVGGLDIYTSTDGGVTLNQQTEWYTNTSNNMSHADIHFLGWHDSVLYCGSDGGVYRSPDNGVSWSDMNRTISTLQYQSADYDPTNPLYMYGGTQDNDKQTTTDGGVTWIQRTTGDGGYTIVDPVNTNYVYGQYVNGTLYRSPDYGVSWFTIAPDGSTGGAFYNPYEMAPSDHNTIVYAQSDVWKTTSAQTAYSNTGWTQIANTTTVGGSDVTGIGISPVNPNKIYIGTNTGVILVTGDNGVNWTTTSGYPFVTDFVVDNANDAVAYATFGGFQSTKHIYKTTNSGTSWFSVTGNLPNIPCNSIILVYSGGRTLYVGTDLGVYKSTNDGASWVAFNNGMPAVEIFDLKYHASASTIIAATHGRGCYTFTLPVFDTVNATASNGAISPAGAVSVTKGSTQQFTFSPNPGYQFDSLVVDGVQTNDSTSSYTFTNIVADHSIAAYYSIIPAYVFTITAGAVNGTINPNGAVSAAEGSAHRFTYSPNTGYKFDSLVVDGVRRTDSTAGFTFSNVVNNHVLTAYFSLQVFTVTAAGSNGTISPHGAVGVTYGSSQRFTYSPNIGYAFDSLVVDGVQSTDSATGYTFTNVVAAHSISAYFATQTFPIALTAGPHGVITPSGTHNVSYDSTFVFTCTPDTGCYLDSVIVDGVYFSNASPDTLANITSPHAVRAVFGLSQVTLHLQLDQFWNLLSVPLTVNAQTREALFPSAVTSAFRYEGAYIASDTLAVNNGYWLKFDSATSVTITGFPIQQETTDVALGWNLIGSVYPSIPTSNIGSVQTDMAVSLAYEFSADGYQRTDTIRAGKGTWIKTNEAGQLILASPFGKIAPKNRPRTMKISEMPPPPPVAQATHLTPALPKEFALEQNYPNPFNPVTTIRYDLPKASFVHLAVFNVIGQEVRTLVNRTEQPGYKSAQLDATNLPSGMYFYKLTAGTLNDVKKMVLIK